MKDCIDNQQADRQPDEHRDTGQHKNISRREFMVRSAALVSLAMNYPSEVLAGLRANRAQVEAESNAWVKEHAWWTLALVQDVLFPPGEDIPGASDFGAVVYLYRAIENPQADGEDRDFIMRGVGWLDDLTQTQYDSTFAQLSDSQQQAMIAQIVKSRAGRNWVSTLLTYILEAMLADPVYGGNKNGMGWKWLEHQPGYPAPPADKTWDRLLQRRYKA